MAIQVNLAMTGAEFGKTGLDLPNPAWMACHFSPGGSGLSNLPLFLPPGTLLILDDQWPMDGHDPVQIQQELAGCIRQFQCCGLLLDFQRPNNEAARALAETLTLPCPVAVTALYAEHTSGPVFLPPLPCHVPLKAHTSRWQGRETWLELSLDREIITLSENGATIAPGDLEEETGFEDKNLHCHYQGAVEEDRAVFKLWRTGEDLDSLIQEAEKLGITRAVGLYQELSAIFHRQP